MKSIEKYSLECLLERPAPGFIFFFSFSSCSSLSLTSIQWFVFVFKSLEGSSEQTHRPKWYSYKGINVFEGRRRWRWCKRRKKKEERKTQWMMHQLKSRGSWSTTVTLTASDPNIIPLNGYKKQTVKASLSVSWFKKKEMGLTREENRETESSTFSEESSVDDIKRDRMHI